MYVEFVHVISMSVSEYIIIPSRQGWRNGSGGAGPPPPRSENGCGSVAGAPPYYLITTPDFETFRLPWLIESLSYIILAWPNFGARITAYKSWNKNYLNSQIKFWLDKADLRAVEQTNILFLPWRVREQNKQIRWFVLWENLRPVNLLMILSEL